MFIRVHHSHSPLRSSYNLSHNNIPCLFFIITYYLANNFYSPVPFPAPFYYSLLRKTCWACQQLPFTPVPQLNLGFHIIPMVISSLFLSPHIFPIISTLFTAGTLAVDKKIFIFKLGMKQRTMTTTRTTPLTAGWRRRRQRWCWCRLFAK